MATIIMAVGDTALPTDWYTVAAGSERTVTILGDSGAELMIEQRKGTTSEGQPIGRLYVSASRPEAAAARIPGPFQFRLVRAAGVTAGAQTEPDLSSSSSSD